MFSGSETREAELTYILIEVEFPTSFDSPISRLLHYLSNISNWAHIEMHFISNLYDFRIYYLYLFIYIYGYSRLQRTSCTF